MSFQNLLSILKERRELAAEERAKPQTTCPFDGVPLVQNPRTGAWACPYGDFQTNGGPREK